jgi:hypothetical protein
VGRFAPQLLVPAGHCTEFCSYFVAGRGCRGICALVGCGADDAVFGLPEPAGTPGLVVLPFTEPATPELALPAPGVPPCDAVPWANAGNDIMAKPVATNAARRFFGFILSSLL